jgi:hypothetical protein
MEDEMDLGMGLFGDTEGLQINTDFIPEEFEDDITSPADGEAEEAEEGAEGEEEEEIIAGEGESLEGVAGEEGEEEGEGDSDKDDISPNVYSSLASVLNEQGLLPSLDLQGDTKIDSADALASAFKSEIQNQVKDFLIQRVGEQGYDALEKGISLSEYQQFQDNVDTLDTITEDNLAGDVELSKRLILQDYISQGLSEKRAQAILKKSIDLGDEQILEDAMASLESLKEVQVRNLEKTAVERQAQSKLAEEQQEKIDNDLKNSIYNAKEFIPGLKLNKTIQDRVYNSITKVVGKNPAGNMENQLMRDRRENPVDFDSKLYYLYEITGGFKDFSKIVSKSESTAISKLEKELRQTKFRDSGTPAFLTDPESYGGVGQELVLD